MLSLLEATGLEPDEVADVLQQNPRAYMAVRGAVAERHLHKILQRYRENGKIEILRTASGDMDKDFYVSVGGRDVVIECKNVEVIKLTTKIEKISYIDYLIKSGLYGREDLAEAMGRAECSSNVILDCSAKEVGDVFKRLPQSFRESGLPKYRFSATNVAQASLGRLSDEDFLNQFSGSPLTIDFQRTRNSTDGDGDTKRKRYYKAGEIDIVAACLFSRTLEWRFLYATVDNFERHKIYEDRYANGVKLIPGRWTSDLWQLIRK